MVLAVFLTYVVEPVAGDVHHVGQLAVYLLYLGPDGGNVLLRLVLVELEDARHTNLHQAQDVLLRHLAHHLRIPGRQTLVDPLAGFVHRLGLLKLTVLVDALLDEDLLQGSEMQLLRKLSLANETLLLEQIERVVHAALEHVAHGEEHRLAVVDDAAVGRDAFLAVGAGIEGVYGLVARSARLQMHQNLHRSGRHILHLAHLDLALLRGFQYAVDEGGGLGGGAGGLAERQFSDGQRLAVTLFYLGTHPDHAAALPVVVARHVDGAARGKVGIEMKLLPAQIFHGSLTDFAQIVGQYFARQTYGDAFGALRQQQRELHRQGDRLFVAAVVGELPLRCLGVEHHVERELRQTGLDITSGGSVVAGEDVAPVTLTVNQQILLPQLHQCVFDAGVTMRMKLHRVSHDVGHFVVAAVVHSLHRMENASLHGLESVLEMRYRTLQYHV